MLTKQVEELHAMALAYKADGLLAEAKAVLLELIQLDPACAPAYNNLGGIYFAEGQWQEAIAAYQTAIDIQADYIDAYYNLGLAYKKAHKMLESKHAFQAVLQLVPDHPGAQFQLGSLFMQQEDYPHALDCFANIAERHPFHFETQTNLATCYLHTGHLDAAQAHYLKALEITPTDEQILFNLGVINMQRGRIKYAIEYYLRAVKINPELFEVHNNLGVAYLAQKNIAAALLHFKEAFRIRPDDVVQHTINVLMRKQNVATAPLEYVRSLFDSYANHYDVHLTKSLHYQVPQLLLQAVQATNGDSVKFNKVLDLGCGTGLCGSVFKPYAHRLVGVDVSSKMLAVAKEKEIYSELVQSDLQPFLAAQSQAYDLIVAGDVLVYCGDLDAIFAAAASALRPGGLFAFNTEMSVDKDYEMTDSGRFAQSKAYIDKLAAKYQLVCNYYKVATLRTQEGQPVQGHLYVLALAQS